MTYVALLIYVMQKLGTLKYVLPDDVCYELCSIATLAISGVFCKSPAGLFSDL